MGNVAATEDAQRAGRAPNCAKKICGERIDAKLKNETCPMKLSPARKCPHPVPLCVANPPLSLHNHPPLGGPIKGPPHKVCTGTWCAHGGICIPRTTDAAHHQWVPLGDPEPPGPVLHFPQQQW